MKSKKAEEFINRNIQPGPYGDGNFSDIDAEQAVELAEADADADFELEREQFRNECSALHAELDNVRERAVRAHTQTCSEYRSGVCYDDPNEIVDCKPEDCATCKEFLSHYDCDYEY